MQDLFITVPGTTLPSGIVVPAFQVGQYLCTRGVDGRATVDAVQKPWTFISYDDARKACERSGYRLITLTQALALSYCAFTTNENHQAAADGNPWLQISNLGGANVQYHISSWLFDDIQKADGENGVSTKIHLDEYMAQSIPGDGCWWDWRNCDGASTTVEALQWGRACYKTCLRFYARLGPARKPENQIGFRCTRTVSNNK